MKVFFKSFILIDFKGGKNSFQAYKYFTQCTNNITKVWKPVQYALQHGIFFDAAKLSSK